MASEKDLKEIEQLDITPEQRRMMLRLADLQEDIRSSVDQETFDMICDVQLLSVEIVEAEYVRRLGKRV